MVSQTPFALIYAVQIKDHLAEIALKFHSIIRATIEEQLRFEPDVETRNRKPLERPLAWEARWELRFGPDNRFRVFYRVEIEEHEVHIVAIGVKTRNRFIVGGQEISE